MTGRKRDAAGPQLSLRARIRIREARPEDDTQVVEMAAELSTAEGRPPPHFGIDDFRRDGFGSGARFAVLVAELDGEPGRLHGYALHYPGYDVASASHGAHLADLYVRPTKRGHGLGRALMAALARQVRQSGGRWLTWHAHRGNLEAIAFYDALGASRPAATAFDMGPQTLERLARSTWQR